MTEEQEKLLTNALPDWAVKPNKRGMSSIHPMAVIDRLNEVFGYGGWNTEVEKLESRAWVQNTKTGTRDMWNGTCKLRLTIPKEGIILEQFGGSPNDDEGDAMKGAATDALTKCASYLGIGASIYKGQGNVEPPKTWTLDEALEHLADSTTSGDLSKRFGELSASMKQNGEVRALGADLRKELTK